MMSVEREELCVSESVAPAFLCLEYGGDEFRQTCVLALVLDLREMMTAKGKSQIGFEFGES